MQEIVSFIKGYIELPQINIPNFAVDYTKLSYNEIEELATATRRHWGLGDGPITNVLGLAENNGIITSRIDLEAETLDALSQWSDYDSTPYIFLSSSKNSAARSRFDISHELAHLTFHKHLSNNVCYNPVVHPVLEKQAHRFASAFLMPAETFMNDLVSPSLDRFWALKEKWQTSIAAMIMRCQHLDIIDEEYARRLWINYNRRGWSRREPLDDKLAIEQPKLLRRSFELLLSSGIIMREDIIHHLPYPLLHLEEILNLPKDTLMVQKTIEYLPSLRFSRTSSDDQLKTADSKIVQFPKRDN